VLLEESIKAACDLAGFGDVRQCVDEIVPITGPNSFSGSASVAFEAFGGTAELLKITIHEMNGQPEAPLAVHLASAWHMLP